MTPGIVSSHVQPMGLGDQFVCLSFSLNSGKMIDKSYLVLAVYQGVGIAGFIWNTNSGWEMKNPANTAHLKQIKELVPKCHDKNICKGT